MKISRFVYASGIGLCLLGLQVQMNSCSSGPDAGKVKADTVAKKPPAPVLHKVEINHMKFEPAELTVKKGDKIVFVNYDMVTHDITEEKNKSWTSSPLKTGEYWTLTVTESADYYCSLHPVMKGKIIAE